MSIWIDQPIWPRHGTVFAHLISDASLVELHEFAAGVGLHPRSFEGDHYDVPQELYADVLSAGATSVSGGELVRRLIASGMRLRKRKGDRPVARVTGVRFPDGGRADIDLIVSDRVIDVPSVFAGMVFLRDSLGRFAVVHSPHRRAWGAPGGWLEHGETAVHAAVREVFEETGIHLQPRDLRPCAYERFEMSSDVRGRWRPGRSHLQVFRADLRGPGPALQATENDVDDLRWVALAGFEELCGREFWWPLVVRLFGEGARGGGRGRTHPH